jgi:hypothetical protein
MMKNKNFYVIFPNVDVPETSNKTGVMLLITSYLEDTVKKAKEIVKNAPEFGVMFLITTLLMKTKKMNKLLELVSTYSTLD